MALRGRSSARVIPWLAPTVGQCRPRPLNVCRLGFLPEAGVRSPGFKAASPPRQSGGAGALRTCARSRADRLTRGSLNLGGIARTFGTGVPDQGVPRAQPVTKGATISDVVFCPDLTLEAP